MKFQSSLIDPDCTDRDQRLRIYLVEDNEIIRNNLTEWLEDVNARMVGFATTEDDAKVWLCKNSTAWDLAVVDMFLEKGGGLGVLKSCQDRSAGQKIVVLSNYATPPIRERSIALGADAVFDKSTELEEFLQFAMNEVERHQADTRFNPW
jgi:two-component system, OmpR family, response regulator